MVDARVLHRTLLVFIILGLGFSLYAAVEASQPVLRNACSINSQVSCGAVLGSGHTTFPPGTSIPDWSWGVAGFLALLALDIPLLRTYDGRLLIAVVGLSVAGVALAAVFGYVEVAVIHALCPVCLGAYLSGVGVLVVSAQLLRLRRAADDSLPSAEILPNREAEA